MLELNLNLLLLLLIPVGDQCVLSYLTGCLVSPDHFRVLYIKRHAYHRGIEEDQGFLLWVDQINPLDMI